MLQRAPPAHRHARAAGRPAGAPAQSIGEHRAGQTQVRLDRLTGALATGGETVGDRQQRYIYLDRRGRLQVGEDHAPRQRLGLVDEEAQAQVMTHERGHMGAQALARAQALEDRARQLGAAGVVAEERDATVAAGGAR